MNKYPYHEAAEHRTAIIGWVCKNCGRYHGNKPNSERMARYCCTHQSTCGSVGCTELSEPNRVFCKVHSEQWHTLKEEERYNRAEKIPSDEWNGWVYLEGFGNEFFESVGELHDEWPDEHAGCDDDENPIQTEPLPAYVYAAKGVPFIVGSAASIYEQISDNAYDEWDGHMKGCKELEQAIEAFNEANKGSVVFHPDYSKAILIRQVDNSTPVCER